MTCPICNKKINGHKNKMYCSIKCRNEAKNIKRRLNNYKKIKCLYCKTVFIQKSINQKFCSANCREKDYYKNNREKELLKVKKYQNTEKGKKVIEKSKNSKANKQYIKSDKYKLSHKIANIKYRKTKKGHQNMLFNNRNRRAKLKKVVHVFTKIELEDKLVKTKGYCFICKKYIGFNNLTLDHIYPISKAKEGFKYTIDDIQFLCRSCNSKKNNKICEEYLNDKTIKKTL